jgi:hypothetical protein
MAAKVFPARLYLGPPGSGKTFSAREYVKKLLELPRRPFIVAHDPEGDWDDLADLALDTDEWNVLGYREMPRGTVWIVDEAHEVLTHGTKHTSTAHKLLTKGRHRGYRLVIITQRPQEIHPRARGVAKYVKVFRFDNDLDTGFLARNWGFDEEKLRRLGLYRSMTWRKK